MASRSEQARQDQATQQRRDAACAHIIANTDGGYGPAIGAIAALIEAIEGERDDIRELRRKGWQSAQRDHHAAVQIVAGWRDLLVAYTPPTPLEAPPAREPVQLPTAHGVGVEPRPVGTADLEQRFVDTFGPLLAPTRHIRTVVREDEITDGVGTRTVPTYGPLCGATTGSFTHPGGANCGTCHAMYAKQNGGAYDGPTAHGNDIPQRRDEPITPTVAREIREEIEAGKGRAEAAATTMLGVPVITDPRMPADEVLIVSPPSADGSFAGDAAKIVDMPTFVDPAPRPAVRERWTAAQVREHALRRQRGAQHRSVSQVEGFADCGTRYALSDLERPAWWNVGGKALHRAVETVNRDTAHTGNVANTRELETLFLRALDAEIADQHAATPQFPMDTWRAGKKGSEHYDFWRVEGPVMVQRWVSWLSGMLADGWTIATAADRAAPGAFPTPVKAGPLAPVIEFETHLNVGLEVPNLSIIDLALHHPGRNALLIVDIKAGASAPKSTFQLGVYGWALLGAGIAGFTPAPDLSNVRGAYWRARTGEAHPPIDDSNGYPVLQMHPWPDVVQRFRDMDTMERHGVYQPNVTSFCGGCGVRDLCPAQATAPSA